MRETLPRTYHLVWRVCSMFGGSKRRLLNRVRSSCDFCITSATRDLTTDCRRRHRRRSRFPAVRRRGRFRSLRPLQAGQQSRPNWTCTTHVRARSTPVVRTSKGGRVLEITVRPEELCAVFSGTPNGRPIDPTEFDKHGRPDQTRNDEKLDQTRH